MVGKRLQSILWRPFASACRRFPLWPFRVTLARPVDRVVCIRIDNLVTRGLSRFGGGYDYAVCYLVDGSLLVDTGFPWARRALRRTLIRLGADHTITTVVNTHEHEDHTGNNDMVADLCNARVFAHSKAVPKICRPADRPWYRSFLFGPPPASTPLCIDSQVPTNRLRFEVVETPGHCPGHICLFERKQKWLFSGDLYIAADLDSQLGDADGPQWIASLEKVRRLKAEWMFDAHGCIVAGADAVETRLQQKIDFLKAFRHHVRRHATPGRTVQEVTRRIFHRRDWVNLLSKGDGWLSLITGSDFSRGNLVRSFLSEIPSSAVGKNLSGDLAP